MIRLKYNNSITAQNPIYTYSRNPNSYTKANKKCLKNTMAKNIIINMIGFLIDLLSGLYIVFKLSPILK